MKKSIILFGVLAFAHSLMAQRDFSPALSPEGTQVAFYRYIDKLPQLMIMNLDGSVLRQITDSDELWSIGPYWSAQGDTLFFSMGEGMANLDVSAIALSTSKIQRSAIDGMQFSLGKSGSDYIWSSREESGMRFYRSLDLSLQMSEPISYPQFKNYWLLVKQKGIYVVVKDEGQEGIYFDAPGEPIQKVLEFKNVQNLSVSANGKWMVFESNQEGQTDIYMAKTNGKNLRNITSSESSDMMPTISGDGKTVVFSSNRDGGFYLYQWIKGQGNLKRLTGMD